LAIEKLLLSVWTPWYLKGIKRPDGIPPGRFFVGWYNETNLPADAPVGLARAYKV